MRGDEQFLAEKERLYGVFGWRTRRGCSL